jgi:multiple sugar transport system permease protein
MTNGGPNNATLFYVLNLYRQAFMFFHMGYASALAWILFLIIMACTLLIFRSSAAWVYYEAEVKG